MIPIIPSKQARAFKLSYKTEALLNPGFIRQMAMPNRTTTKMVRITTFRYVR
jgi:hypothetical protein